VALGLNDNNILPDRNIPREFRTWPAPALEPGVLTSLNSQAERALAKRSMAGAMVYFLVTIVVALSTPYYSDHPVILSVVACFLFVTGIVRIAASRRLLADAPVTADIRHLFLGSIYTTAIVWGAFCAGTVHLYRRDWTAMFVLLNTAALTAGASSSLAPSFALALRYLILLMGPTVVSSLLLRDPGYVGFAFVTAIYFGFLVAQTRSNWWAFWSANVAAEREKLRGSAEIKRGEAERATLVAAIEEAAEEILITDTEGNIRYCNRAFERVTGYARTEVIGRNPRLLKSGQHDEDYYRQVWATILEGRIWSGRFTNLRKDGSAYETEGTIAPMHDESGRLTGFVSAWRDITERLRLESELRQAQKMESIGRLAGGVAHDFNNLLTVITGYSDLLETALKTGDPLHPYVKEIRAAGDRAASLTKQLLAFSRKQLIRPVVLDLNQLVEETQDMIRRLVGEDVFVEIRQTTDLLLVSVDPAQITQILMNLAANARDAMPHGGHLTIRTGKSTPPEGDTGESGPDARAESVVLAVTDTGEGMPEEIRQHLFEPFFTTKELGRGTGLGLSSVYGIVRQSEGRIEVQSEPGKGSTFTIYFPALESSSAIEPVPDALSTSPLSSTTGSRASGTVMVVEDQAEVRRLIVAVLESKGFKVLEAEGGDAALALSRQYAETIHLLITDLIMPGMTGKQIADLLVSIRPGLKVLYISGYSGDVLTRRGVPEPDFPYLVKPFTPQTLSARVYEVLGSGEAALNDA
jgi:PAS domain S-box-containing protein